MAAKKINPTLKMVLELGPVVLFFIGYLKLKDEVFLIGGSEYKGFIVITAAFIPLMVASTLALWKLTGHLSRMQFATLILVVLFGGMSVWFNDDRFIKMKPTMLYLLFGGLLGLGLMRGQSWLKVVMEELMPLKQEGWMILTRRLCAFFFGLAVANELIWRSQSTETWVYFKTFGLPVAMFAFFMLQGQLFQKYSDEEEAGPAE
ncbi:inner membrane-spanning protein YciB [Leisingera aquaemixtae]|jgi:intracellular septation protein|uniref:Inner membrane-spanning protein YciB n=1 Tax=Leisingera aquaemixtae TaxID=1396826 RepID=A0ABY5WM09_9RHOB|nr:MULTISPECIES: inner membrane-spanning protein YciB [Leisingera]QDI76392.1 septation protein IspZ [Leisingera aquaemixtae]UWQ25936.1 septation protein IspZ [Leisingera aquaemixtae]UWQ38439.1 septation protein IspZ [Leisingera aquaemixtae]UWQ42557.1 septation protein IspZ [Leisingera aquaemixtae]UWQ46845.1 septation protein IspZ [Leisingera aquaemixtae]